MSGLKVKTRCMIGLSLVLAGALVAAPQTKAADDERERAAAKEARILALEASVALQVRSAARLRKAFDLGAAIESRVIEAELKLAEAQAELAAARGNVEAVIVERVAVVEEHKRQLKRVERLHKAGAVGKGEVEKARAALLSAELRLAQARAKLPKRQALNGNPQLKKLLIERRDVLRRRLELTTKAFEVGETMLETIVQSASDLTDAELELVTQQNERIILHEKRITMMRRFEMIARERLKLGVGSQLDVLAATAARLQAQIKLARE